MAFKMGDVSDIHILTVGLLSFIDLLLPTYTLSIIFKIYKINLHFY